MRRPFEQLPFDDVPELPRVPHGWAKTKAETVRVASRPFGDVDVHVRTYGRGPPIVLVHGFMTTSYSWRYVFEPLGERFTVYAPDLVGAGRSSKPDLPHSPDALAESIGETMRALGVWGANVIGNSLGGYLAMRLALQSPTAIKRLVNLHSPGIPTPRMRALKLAMTVLPFQEAILRKLVWRDPERWVHRNVHYFDETLKSREEHREYAAPLRTPEGLRSFVRMLRETLAVDEMSTFAATLARTSPFPVPLLLAYAEKDPMVPPEVGDRLLELVPEATFVRLEKASHFAHVDSTAQFLAAIEGFLRG